MRWLTTLTIAEGIRRGEPNSGSRIHAAVRVFETEDFRLVVKKPDVSFDRTNEFFGIVMHEMYELRHAE